MALDFTYQPPAGALVPLDEVKAHLGITDTAHDADILSIRDAAQEKILAYLTTAADPAWTAITAPMRVKHAIKILTAHFDRERGDLTTEPDTDKLWREIANLLAETRDPTLA